jgi:hypothetical protein
MASTPLDIPLPRAPRSERSVYTWGAIAALAIAFAGFAPSYYLKSFFGSRELTPIQHLHGVVMTTWLVLFFVQVRLVAKGRIDLHRLLGVAGLLVAIAVVGVGMAAAIASGRAGFAPPGIPPLAFIAIPVGDMVAFTGLVGAALWLRKRSAWHKRLMLVVTLSMLTPAIARLMIMLGVAPIPPLFFGFVDLLIVACAVYDWRRTGRFHPAFAAGLAFLVFTQVGRLVLSQTQAWTDFAKWLIA